jgi:flagellar hook-length control protein FliK
LSDNAAPRFSLFQDVIANDMNGSLEKGSTNFSLSEFPNDPAFEANDKLKFVEPRTARFSEVSASADARPGVSTPELSLNPEWLKTEVSQLQDERISSYASNSDSYPAQDEEAMSTAQTAQVPFAEFYTLPVATPGNYESTPGTRAARAQSLFKTLDQQPTDKPPVRFTPGQQLGALPVMAPGKESMQGIPPVSGETTSAFSENVRQAASLSELPNERAFEANDKPEFVEPRAARFSEVGVGVATPELSLNPEWSKTVDAPPQTENLSVPANLSSSLSIDQMPSLAETRTEVRPVQPDADNGFRDEMPRPVARHIEADAQDFGNVPDQQPVNEPLARTDFAGTLEPGIFAPDAQQSLAGDAATVERVPVLPTLTRQQAEVSSIAPSGRDDQLASEPANVQRPFGTQNGNPSGNASGIEIEYSELLPQGSEAAPVVASSPAESKESLPQATTIANEEAILFGARGPRFERDELRLRNMTAAQSATASPAESKESFTSAAPLSGIEQDQVERVAPQHDLSAFSTGVSRRATGDSSVRAVQPEESFEPALMASRNIENVEQASSPRESGQIEVSPTLLEEKPAKVGRRGEAAVDKADTDLSAPAANNAAVSKMAGAKLEEPNATVRHLTPPLIEASESLTPGKPHTLRLNLRPVDLGPVEIQITRDANGHLNAHLTVEREVAGQTLSEGIPQLREALERAGLQVDRLVVSINTGGNGEGQARHPDAQQFTPTSEPDFFETDPGHIGGEAAEDRLLNLHA